VLVEQIADPELRSGRTQRPQSGATISAGDCRSVAEPASAAAAARRQRLVHGRTWRDSFLLGAVARLARRLDARRAETTGTEENGRAPVVVKTAVDRRIERHWPELESSRYRASVARGAYEAGSHARSTSTSATPG
jgi:hypothetical protein